MSKHTKEFITEHINSVCIDSSYSPEPDVSLYVYSHSPTGSNHRIFYVVNQQFLYFYVFYSLDDTMEFINDGKTNGCVAQLSLPEMLELDPDVEE